MTEMAFMQAFLAWEMLMEESFILYLVGHEPPRGRPPNRYAFPPDQKTAREWVVPERRGYAEWNDPGEVSGRAQRFFRAGRPFAAVLRSNQNVLEEVRAIRNAIAHRSATARGRFERIVRAKLGVLPPHLSVGGFLGMPVPGRNPPVSFLEVDLARIDLVAQQIIPS